MIQVFIINLAMYYFKLVSYIQGYIAIYISNHTYTYMHVTLTYNKSRHSIV